MESTKEVYFYVWCPRCVHSDKEGTEDPCNECLTEGFNIDSHKPVNFVKKDDQ